jgi:glycosyltransferase involved in cell wall biosynthesis
MKIIYIANTRLPTEMAHGLQVMKMCEAFVKNGAELELVVPLRFHTFELGKRDAFEYYKIDKIFKIKKIFSLDLTPLNRYLGPVSSLIQALSFSFFVFIYLLFNPVIRQGKKPDIIYSRDRFSLFCISFFKKNTVFEIHKIHRTLDIGISKRAKKLITITKGLEKELIKRGIRKEKILIAPDAIDFEDFETNKTKKECREELNLSIAKKIVVYTGHLYKWKGVGTLALASKFLEKDTIVIIVGGIKWYLSNFKKFVKKNNLKNILILGYQDYSKIPYYLKAGDCLVLTGTKKSKTSKQYTSPMKMFEYMASNRPIVASDLPSFREALNGNNSILIEPDNPRVLADGIKKVLKNKNLAQKISEEAYKDVQKYTWDNRAKKILKFINF